MPAITPLITPPINTTDALASLAAVIESRLPARGGFQ
jgi:hypothetical protein